MKHQFLHVEVFGFKPNRNRRHSRHGIDGILGEAGRVPGYIPHIKGKPDVRNLYGESFTELRRRLLDIYVSARDQAGRHLRSTASILVSGVVSFPHEWTEFLSQPILNSTYRNWVSQTINWLKVFHGNALRKVVEHRDERFPHLHYFVVPDNEPDGIFTLDQAHIHPGRYRKRLVHEQGGSNQEGNIHYKAGMREMQDDYFASVSSFFGFKRISIAPTWRFTRKQVLMGLHTQARFRKMQEVLSSQGPGSQSDNESVDLPSSDRNSPDW